MVRVKRTSKSKKKAGKTRPAAGRTSLRRKPRKAVPAGKDGGTRGKAKKTEGKTAGASGEAARPVAKIRKNLSKAAKARMAKLRAMLEQRRVEILASIRKTREDAIESQRQTFSEVGDLVSASLEKEMAFQYGEQGVNLLREIDTALEKLEEGNYGICEACGKLIGVKRLEVVPSARLCIKCKASEEQGGA